MKQITKEFKLSSLAEIEIIDLTNRIEEIVQMTGIKDGFCLIQVPHATAAIVVNESEERLKKDFIDTIKQFFYKRGYKHDEIDDNAKAHMASIFLGQARILLVKDGTLLRGAWQDILFIELDGPRSNRSVVVKVIGD